VIKAAGSIVAGIIAKSSDFERDDATSKKGILVDVNNRISDDIHLRNLQVDVKNRSLEDNTLKLKKLANTRHHIATSAYRKPKPCSGRRFHANVVTQFLGDGWLFFWIA